MTAESDWDLGASADPLRLLQCSWLPTCPVPTPVAPAHAGLQSRYGSAQRA